MADRPSLLPAWATNASAEVTEPNASKRGAGWITGESPSAAFFNWLFLTIYRWILYLDAGHTQQVTIQALYEALSDTQVGILKEAPSLFTGAVGDDVVVAGSNGPYLVRATTSANPIVVARGALGTTLRTLTRANAGTNRAIHVRGDFVVVGYGNYVDAFRISTGTRLWSYNHGGTVRAVWWGRQYVYLAGDAGTGSYEARALVPSNGSLSASYTHGATLYAICESAELVLIGGAGGSGGSHELVALSTGLSANWTVSYATDVLDIATDEKNVYVCRANMVLCIDRADGSTIWESDRFLAAGYAVVKITVDQGGVWALVTDGSTPLVFGLDKKTGASYYREDAHDNARGVFSDGAAIWTHGNAGAGQPGLTGLYRPNQAGQWYRLTTPAASPTWPIDSYRANPRYVSWLLQPLNEE